MHFDWSSIGLLKNITAVWRWLCLFQHFNIQYCQYHVHSIPIARAFFSVCCTECDERKKCEEETQQMFTKKKMSSKIGRSLNSNYRFISLFALYKMIYPKWNAWNGIHIATLFIWNCAIHPFICVYNAKCGCSRIWVLIKE